MTTVDPLEIEKFERMAHEWWDPEGKFKPLHQLNPVRSDYIREVIDREKSGDWEAVQILDIGCGGGLLSEAASEWGAQITAIDRSDKTIGVAKAHQQESGSRVDYRVQSTTELCESSPGRFDAVLAMEVLEHVPNVPGFLTECATLLKPGGLFFFSTLNRTWRAWLMAIVGAEYVLGWLPRGTHEYEKFIRPSDLSQDMRRAGLHMRDLSGMSYAPLTGSWRISRDPSINYLGFGVRTDVG